MREKIIFFTKIPQLGYSKSRLKGFLDDKAILQLSRNLVERSRQVIAASDVDAVIYYCGDPSAIEPDLPMKPQTGNGLGERMFNALAEELKSSDRVILVGSDLIGLTPELIREALASLCIHDIVLAPTRDGGYGLIGMKQPCDVFSGITYSRHDVFENTLSRIREKRLAVSVLPTIFDIDTRDDLVREELKTEDFALVASDAQKVEYRFGEGLLYQICLSKAPGETGGLTRVEREFRILKELEQTGFAPKAYLFKTGSEWIPYSSLVVEEAAGRPLDYENDMKQAAHLLARIHLQQPLPAFLPRRSLASYKAEALASYHGFPELCEQHKASAALIRRLAFAARRMDDIAGSDPCLIHGALSPKSFQFGERSLLIGWHKAAVGDAEEDIAHLLLPDTAWTGEAAGPDEAQQEAFIESYETHRQVDCTLLKRYLLLRALSGLCRAAVLNIRPTGPEGLFRMLDRIM